MEETINQMLEEIIRVLVDLGRYLLVTLAQAHIVQKIVDFFMPKYPSCLGFINGFRKQFLLRVYKSGNSSVQISMPVFVFVITKLKMPLPLIPVTCALQFKCLFSQLNLLDGLKGMPKTLNANV